MVIMMQRKGRRRIQGVVRHTARQVRILSQHGVRHGRHLGRRLGRAFPGGHLEVEELAVVDARLAHPTGHVAKLTVLSLVLGWVGERCGHGCGLSHLVLAGLDRDGCRRRLAFRELRRWVIGRRFEGNNEIVEVHRIRGQVGGERRICRGRLAISET